MIIGLDAMGGDFAPESAIQGAVLASQDIQADARIALLGNEGIIRQHLSGIDHDPDRFVVFHAPEVIEMAEHPTRALTQKPHSSISVGFHLLESGKIGGFCSAGNTGAMLVGAMFSIKPIPGIIRPALASYIPRLDGSWGIILDVGANADCKAEVLAQFGEMGSLYAEYVLGIENPRVGLVNLGEEESKGTVVTQAAYQLLKNNERINFIGNIEGRDLFVPKSDVVVVDGFTGNVVLKMAESMFEYFHNEHGKADSFFNNLNYEFYGGTPIIGVNGNVVIGHGVSSPLAISNMIKLTLRMMNSDVHHMLKTRLPINIPQA